MKENIYQTTVITGAASGIGREFAYDAAGKGFNLALIDINLQGLKDLKKICKPVRRDESSLPECISRRCKNKYHEERT